MGVLRGSKLQICGRVGQIRGYLSKGEGLIDFCKSDKKSKY